MHTRIYIYIYMDMSVVWLVAAKMMRQPGFLMLAGSGGSGSSILPGTSDEHTQILKIAYMCVHF